MHHRRPTHSHTPSHLAILPNISRGAFHRWKMVWNPDSIPYIFHISSWKWNGIFHIFIYDVKYAYLVDKCASAGVYVGTLGKRKVRAYGFLRTMDSGIQGSWNGMGKFPYFPVEWRWNAPLQISSSSYAPIRVYYLIHNIKRYQIIRLHERRQ